jgi:hypothetical protein
MENDTIIAVARLDERLKGMAEVIKANREYQEASTNAAYERMEQRLLEMNNLRAQILQERGSFVSRDLFDVQMNKTTERIDNLANSLNAKIEVLNSTQNKMIGGMVVLQVVIFIILKFWK